MSRYKGRDRSVITREQAEKYGPYIHKLSKRKKGVTADELVEKAKSNRCPLHDWFEWDDTKAARWWRKEQAKYLLRNIVIEVEVPGQEEPVDLRVTHHVVLESGDLVYKDYELVVEVESLRDQVLASCLREIRAWQQKYAGIEAVAFIVEAVNDALESVA